MAYERWLLDQLEQIDPLGNRALYYDSSRGYYFASLPGNGKLSNHNPKGELVLLLDREARLALLMEEVASYAARGRHWYGYAEAEPDRWASQKAHFRERIAREVRKAIRRHRREKAIPADLVGSALVQVKPTFPQAETAA